MDNLSDATTSRRALVLAVALILAASACTKPGTGSNAANGSNNKPAQPEPQVPTKITTPPRAPAPPPQGTGVANTVQIGQRVRVAEWELVVSGPWKDGDGQVIDPVRGADSYGPDKKFVFVPVEVSKVVGEPNKVVDGNNLTATFTSADPANPKPEDFATNCPYDESWPNKLDLWKATASGGETLQGNACFIVPVAKLDAFVITMAPFGQKAGTETYFATH